MRVFETLGHESVVVGLQRWPEISRLSVHHRCQSSLQEMELMFLSLDLGGPWLL